ncbi:hypothetical protein BRE01_60260 [Brevibacillus reuszeri]|uniref:DNA gyrase inhibitor YacG n=1 Tax=Brevibacillus reuszeri TaxID=54915 RepID=A0ABQ0TXC0_9BACL|nr:hypothetical protein BRE01_60260 [Brevibacillus reuszeri]
MSNGYIRYEEAIEEPHNNCKACGVNFKLIVGYPSDMPDFCSRECYMEKIN